MSITLRYRKLKKGGSTLWIDYYINGVRTNETIKDQNDIPLKVTGNKKLDAEKLAYAYAIIEEREKQIEKGISINQIKENLNLSYLIDKYLNSKTKDYEVNRLQLIKLLKFTGEISVLNIDFLTAAKYWNTIQNKDISNTTKNHYLAILNTFFKWCIESKFISENPFKDVKKLKAEKFKRTFLSPEEIKQFSKTTKYINLKRAFLFSCFTGLRYSDIKNLKWSDINDNYIYIRIQKTKDLLTIPLNRNANNILNELDNSTEFVFPNIPKIRRTLKYQLDAILKDIGIEKHITFHSARHTFATLTLSLTNDIYTTSKLLGHKDISTTQIYANLIDANKRNVVNSLDVVEL